MKLKASLMVMLSVSALTLTACGSLPSAVTASITPADSLGLTTLSANGTASDTASARAGLRPEGGPGGERGVKGHGGPGFGFINPQALASLNLTAEQKTQIQAVMAEAKTFMEANKPTDTTAQASDQATHEAARAAFEAAFISDNFDPSTLTANRPARPTPSEAMLDFQVDQMIKLHDILTAEQRAQLAAADTTATTQPSPPADATSRETARLDQLASNLSLTDTQKSQIQAIFTAEATARQTEMTTRRSAMEAEKAQYKALLVQDTVDRAALKALIQARSSAEPNQSAQADQLVQIHAILTTEQRAKWLEQDKGRGGQGGPGGQNAGPGGKAGGFGGGKAR
jgi:Spy/CpxP family protein refolding chaperone